MTTTKKCMIKMEHQNKQMYQIDTTNKIIILVNDNPICLFFVNHMQTHLKCLSCLQMYLDV